MTGQFTSLTPVTMRQIISHLDDSIRLMESSDRQTVAEIKIKSMLVALRRQMIEYVGQRLDETEGR